MTAVHPQRLDSALDATLRDWQTLTGQAPPMAIFCADEHPVTGALCKRIACDGTAHDYDGLPPWCADTDPETRESK